MRALILTLALFTLTAHAQWEMQNSGTTADLRGIHSLGGGIAWASGSNGTVLRTEDGGYLWQHCTTPPGAEHLDFRGIQAFDENTAIVMSSGKGDLSRLYKTTDGCQSWKLVFTNPDKDGFWDAVEFDDRVPVLPSKDFRDRKFGVLIGDPVNNFFAVWETRDSGSTWTRWNDDDKKHLPRAVRGESLFAASNESLLVPGNNGGFAFATGGSLSRLCSESAHSPFDAALWLAVDCRPTGFAHSITSGAFAIGQRSAGKLYGYVYRDLLLIGGDYAQPDAPGYAVFFPGIPREFFGYRNRVRSTTPPHGYRSAVAYDAPTKTWITVGPNGTDISTDDGRNWHPLTPSSTDTPDADRNWNALSLPFVVGPHGRIGLLRPNSLSAVPK